MDFTSLLMHRGLISLCCYIVKSQPTPQSKVIVLKKASGK